METNLLTLLQRYERGMLNHTEELRLFATLIRSGLAWTWSQSTYDRAAYLVNEGFISTKGDLLPMAKATMVG